MSREETTEMLDETVLAKGQFSMSWFSNPPPVEAVLSVFLDAAAVPSPYFGVKCPRKGFAPP